MAGAGAAFTIERTPEDWLLKARTEAATVDVPHRLDAEPVAPDAVHEQGDPRPGPGRARSLQDHGS